jgi:VanZ family protein
MKLSSILRSAYLWFLLYACWFGTLWFLSSGPVAVKTGVEIPHFDKVAHFGYFFGGSGLLCAFLYRVSRARIEWSHLLVVVMLTMVSVGSLDEWHQSWVPERSGNDALDLCADVLGSLAGYCVFRRFHSMIADSGD